MGRLGVIFRRLIAVLAVYGGLANVRATLDRSWLIVARERDVLDILCY